MKAKRNKPATDITGLRFGRLTVTGFSHYGPDHEQHWDCVCDCGKTCKPQKQGLRRGTSSSCGCYCAERRIEVSTSHKMHNSPEYITWAGMKSRCKSPLHTGYKYYGGLGVTVCERWQLFENFFADMGPKPSPIHSIDRINPYGNYEPSNCRWATPKEQANNKRKSPCIAKAIEKKGEE